MRRRVTGIDLMMGGTILIWALNLTVTRYVVIHGFHPLAYSTTRYGASILLFLAFTWWRERSFRIARADLPLILVAAVAIFVNQLFFVYSLRRTSASTVGLLLGTTPIFVGLIATAFGFERLTRWFWIGAVVSFGGVGLIAAGPNGSFSGDVVGDLMGVCVALTWGGYTTAIAPLMRRYSALRISSVVLLIGWFPLAVVGWPQLSSQSFAAFGWTMWLAFAFAVVGPLFLTNILWFNVIKHVGPSRASLFANLQPFIGVLLAIVLLSESLNGAEIVGGAAIAIGIALERRSSQRRRAAALAEGA